MTRRILPTKHHLHIKHNLSSKCFAVFGSIFLKGKNKITFGIRHGNHLMKRTDVRAAQTSVHIVTDSVLQQSCPCWQGTLSRPEDWFNTQQWPANGIARKDSCQPMGPLDTLAACMRRIIISLFFHHSNPIYKSIAINWRKSKLSEKNCILFQEN